MFHTFLVASSPTSITQFKSLNHNLSFTAQKPIKSIICFSHQYSIYIWGFWTTFVFKIIFEVFSLVNTIFFFLIPSSFREIAILRKYFSCKWTRFGSKGIKKEPFLVHFHGKYFRKIAISLKLFGIKKKSLRYKEKKTSKMILKKK